MKHSERSEYSDSESTPNAPNRAFGIGVAHTPLKGGGLRDSDSEPAELRQKVIPLRTIDGWRYSESVGIATARKLARLNFGWRPRWAGWGYPRARRRPTGAAPLPPGGPSRRVAWPYRATVGLAAIPR